MPFIALDTQGNPWSMVIDATTQAQIWTPSPGVTPSTNDNSISVTALSLISSALRLIGVIASGETIDIAAANDSLAVLQQMIDSWNADRLAIYTTRADEFAFVANQQDYTLGPGGDFNTNRPSRIDSMSAILLDNPTNPLELPMTMYTVDQWQTQVPVKAVPGTFPYICYDDGGFPQRTLSFWPIPQTAIHHVRMYSWQSLTWPATLNSVLAFPPGYAEAFRYNLSVRLAAEFATQVPEVVQMIAVQSLARLKTMNAPELLLRSDLVGDAYGWNYKADLFGLPY